MALTKVSRNLLATSIADNGTNTAITIASDGSVTFSSTISASGYNNSNWDTAYSWGDHSAQSYATQSYVNTQVANLVDSAPSTLDTLNELASALGDDANFSTTVTNSIATKLSLSGGTLTGNLTIDQGTSGDATLTLRSDTDNNDESDHPDIRFKQDGDLVDWRIGIGRTATDTTGDASNSLFVTHLAGTADGFRYSSDGTTSYKIWHEGNDGSGSGLDADTVDGLQASQFLRSDANDTFSGALTSSNRSNGIFGTYDSTKTDHIWSIGTSYKNNSAGTDFGNIYGAAYKHTNNTTGGTMGGSHQFLWCHNGSPKCSLGTNIWTSGNVTAYSDIRVKENIELIPNALDKVSQLNGYTFDRTDVTFDEHGEPETPVRQTGVIAQEVLEVLPEAVIGNEEGHYSVAYGNMVGLLIEAVKELKAEIDELKGVK